MPSEIEAIQATVSRLTIKRQELMQKIRVIDEKIASAQDLMAFCKSGDIESSALDLKPIGSKRRKLQGNCTYHKEWIENASHTTCSDMANEPLKDKGIYRLLPNNGDGWSYVRRPHKLRTRLFLIKNGVDGSNRLSRSRGSIR